MQQLGNPGALAYGDSNQEIVFATAHEALNAGEVVFLGAGTSGLATVAIPSAKLGRCAVAVHDVAKGAVGQFVIRGACKAKVYVDGSTTTATTVGKALTCDTSVALMFEQEAGGPGGAALESTNVHCGVVLVAGTDSTADTIVFVYGEQCLSTS